MRARVIGLGNVLMHDDAFGPYVVRLVEALYDVPTDVEVVDVGTPGLDLIPYVCGADLLIVVDTIRGGAAGEIRVVHTADILAEAVLPRLGPHDPGIKEALLTAAVAGAAPREVLLVGVAPQSVEPGVRLSPPVRWSLEPVVARVVAELAARGVELPLRPAPRQPAIWWEEPASDRAPTNFPAAVEFSRAPRCRP